MFLGVSGGFKMCFNFPGGLRGVLFGISESFIGFQGGSADFKIV